MTCIDLNGKLLWNLEAGNADLGKNAKATGANSSPVSDGNLIFAYFKSGELIALRYTGQEGLGVESSGEVRRGYTVVGFGH